MQSIRAHAPPSLHRSGQAPSKKPDESKMPKGFSDAMANAALKVKAAGPDGGQPPGEPKKLSADDKRPADDHRSAKEIVDGDPTLKNLGNQSGVKDALKKQVGDFDKDADAAFRASEVLHEIKTAKNADGKERSGDVVNNGKVEGFTKDGDARHGTEAGLLQDFGKNGYSALKNSLDKTNDGHVRKDGTNMDNAEFAGHEILHGLSEAAGFMGKVLEKTLGKIPGVGKVLAAGGETLASAISGALNVADTAVQHGDVKQAGKKMGYDVAQTAVESIVGLADPTGVGASAVGKEFRKGIEQAGGAA